MENDNQKLGKLAIIPKGVYMDRKIQKDLLDLLCVGGTALHHRYHHIIKLCGR